MIIDLCVARACALVGPGLATPLPPDASKYQLKPRKE